jgi:hypothetical protein
MIPWQDRNFYEVNALIGSRLNTFPTNKTLGIFRNKFNFMKPCKFILAFLSTIILFTACSKDSDNNKPKTNTDLLVQGSWKFDNVTVNGADVSSLVQGCQKDNTLTFAAGGTGTLDEGATKCSSNDPQSSPFTWSFATNETVLHVSATLFTGGSSDFNIVTLNETQLILSQNIDISGTSQNAIVSFKH